MNANTSVPVRISKNEQVVQSATFRNDAAGIKAFTPGGIPGLGPIHAHVLRYTSLTESAPGA